MPDEVELSVLIHALRSGDPAAPDAFVTACASRLFSLLRKSFPFLEKDIVSDAAHDALLFLIRYPERYRPEKSSVLNFLVMVGSRRLLDTLRRIKNQKEIFVGGSVELALVTTNQFVEDEHWEANPDVLAPEITALLEETLPDARDRQLWNLICESEGRTSVMEAALLLNITHWPLLQQQAEWKRHRDRILKRIRRRQQEFHRLLVGDNV